MIIPNIEVKETLVRRYWIKDYKTERKELTAVTKPFNKAIEDISFCLKISRYEAKMKLLKKRIVESKNQIWIIITEGTNKNPFDLDFKGTKLE